MKQILFRALPFFLLFPTLFSGGLELRAQSAFIINDGARIIVGSNATIRDSGSFETRVNGGNIGETHNDGVIVTEHQNPANASFTVGTPDALVRGDGLFEIEGDWVNNGVFMGDNGEVLLDGPGQLITGDSVSTFHDLSLAGTGTKTQALDAEVTDTLDLNDRELHTDTNTMFVLNPDPTAIQRTPGSNITVAGFVSSDSTGWLQREMDQSQRYLFPLGDSSGTPRYRPLSIAPSTSNPHSYRSRLSNQDPTLDGYDVTNTQPGVANVNDLFYWRIQRPNGGDPAEIRMHFDNAVENGQFGVHWQPSWDMMGGGAPTYNASPQLSYIEESGYNSFSPDPFNIAESPLQVDAGNDDTICIGDTVQLNATASGGVGPYGYTWTPSTYLNDTTIQDPQAQGVMDTITYYVTAYDSSNGSTSFPDSVTVFVDPGPNMSVVPDDTSVCPGDSVQLVASGADSITWSPGTYLDTTEGDTVWSTPGSDTTYQVIGVNDLGCVDTTTAQVQLGNFPSAPTATASPDTICEGESSVIDGTGSGANVLYQVYDDSVGGNYLGDAPYSVSPTTDSTFYVQAVDSIAGCAYPGARDSVQVIVNPAPPSPTVTLSPDSICPGDSAVIDASGSGSGASYEVYDAPAAGTYLGNTALTVYPNASSDYFVQAVDSNGCSPLNGRDSVHIDVLPPPSVTIGPDTSICPGDSAVLSATSPASPIYWSTGDTSTSITVAPDSAEQYAAYASNSIGCEGGDTVQVDRFDPGTLLANDDSVTVETGSSIDIDVLLNDTGDLSSPSGLFGPFEGNASLINDGFTYDAPDQGGEDSIGYVVCHIACNGYCDSAVVHIRVEEPEELFIPNGVSVNGDGYNDVFEISGLERFPENSLIIYNRWGDEVFRAEPYENDWEGQSSSGKVVAGTYYFVLDLGPDEEKHTGFIELIR